MCGDGEVMQDERIQLPFILLKIFYYSKEQREGERKQKVKASWNRERERENKRSRPPGTERGREKTKGRGLLDHGLLKKRRKVNIKQLRSPSTILDLAQLHDYFPVIFSIMHVSKEKGNGCLRL